MSDQEKGVARRRSASAARRGGDVRVGSRSSSSRHGGSLAAFLGFIVKQPGAVSGSAEAEGEEGREVERQAGSAALIRSTETPLPPTPPPHPPDSLSAGSRRQ